MDTCWGPPNPSGPPTLHDLSRPPNGQGLGAQPFTICKWTRVHDLSRPPSGQGLGAPNPSRLEAASKSTRVGGPQPFTICKCTRVGGPPTLHDLSRPPNGQGLGAPKPFQMDKGCGPPNLSRLEAASKWTRFPGS